jgi:hypothetical protein
MKTAAVAAFLLLSSIITGPTAAQPAGQALATEEFMIPVGDPGVQLYVRNKHPRGATRFTADIRSAW